MAPVADVPLSHEVAANLHLIPECGDKTERAKRRAEDRFGLTPWYDADDRIHNRMNAFLFDGDETVLFETLSAKGTDRIHDALDHLLDGRPLDYLVISHTDQPHCANAASILDRYPDCTLLSPAYGQPDELYMLGEADPVTGGDVLDIGDFRIEFCEADFLDAAKSVWLFERRTGTLFTADWFSFDHTPDECLKFVDELDRELTVTRLLPFHRRVFFWFEYADVGTVHARMDRILDRYDPDILAPSHGLLIREDLEGQFELMKETIVRLNRATGATA